MERLNFVKPNTDVTSMRWTSTRTADSHRAGRQHKHLWTSTSFERLAAADQQLTAKLPATIKKMASYTQQSHRRRKVAGLMSASERRRRFIAAEAEKENALKARAVNALAEDEALAARLQDAENTAASEPVAFNAHSDTLTEEALARASRPRTRRRRTRRWRGGSRAPTTRTRRSRGGCRPRRSCPRRRPSRSTWTLVRQVAGRIERLTVDQAQRERADAALALRLQNAELTQGSAVPEEKDDDAAMAARLQRDEA